FRSMVWLPSRHGRYRVAADSSNLGIRGSTTTAAPGKPDPVGVARKRLPTKAISGLTRYKKRVISEIARSQYSCSTELPQKNMAISYRGLLVWLGRCRRPTGVSDIGKRERTELK